MSSTKLLVKCEDEDEPHPHCRHGPTIFFYTEEKGEEYGYYRCAANRDTGGCNYYVAKLELSYKLLTKRYPIATQEYHDLGLKFQANATGEKRHYCLTCNLPMLNVDVETHKDHNMVNNLLPRDIADPTRFLPALQCDKREAQYFFDANALRMFAKCFKELNINKVICMGAPRLHAYLCDDIDNGIQSYLLDLDHRFYYFFDRKHFGWYNMCNNYFFDEEDELQFQKLIKCGDDERMLIFTDPPFGCRTEIIANTLRQLTNLINTVNEVPHQPVPIFWIYPYYSEHHIREQMGALQMCDYKVNYTNHAVYTDIGNKSRSLGSPVRIFTNVPLDMFSLPVGEGYKFCAICKRYTALENRHCKSCGICPSKNGSTYRHCKRCDMCVKPSYKHCTHCRRCAQVEGHKCTQYQQKQRCWICLQRGHIERQCPVWWQRSRVRNDANLKIISCLLCGGVGHNERYCKRRAEFIEETTFLGKTELHFRV